VALQAIIAQALKDMVFDKNQRFVIHFFHVDSPFVQL
jgi:hypothetical protein